MIAKLLFPLALSLVSVSCAAQVAPPVTIIVLRYPPPFGGGMNYSSGDWGRGDINRWGPSAWATVTIWHDLSVIAEGHSMICGWKPARSD